ncbi:hypothetical protein ANRL4_04155 [Anaerolineae bacterium]|nr:hypothetical protein ANRL4_04155 [Anaerolineae bacterium]
MGADVQMDYEVMEKMRDVFKIGSDQLGETLNVMNNLAQMMEQGALLGDGGELFAQALRARLAKKLQNLQRKFAELSQDVNGAVRDLRDGDKEAASRFKG